MKVGAGTRTVEIESDEDMAALRDSITMRTFYALIDHSRGELDRVAVQNVAEFKSEVERILGVLMTHDCGDNNCALSNLIDSLILIRITKNTGRSTAIMRYAIAHQRDIDIIAREAARFRNLKAMRESTNG